MEKYKGNLHFLFFTYFEILFDLYVLAHRNTD